MSIDQRLTNVSVLGAGGKMGSGIALLLAQQMVFTHLKPENRDKNYILHAIDLNEEALAGLMKYIRIQATKTAEKSTVLLRQLYADREDLVENAEIINEFVNEVLSVIQPGSEVTSARNSHLVFEAIVEKASVKIEVFSELQRICSKETFFFTNTSSIPIKLIDTSAHLDGRLVGFHFYNPPAVQKLVEVITHKGTKPEIREAAEEIGLRLGKKLIPSNDVAGFIGNGHFIRDGLHALSQVDELADLLGSSLAVVVVDWISRELLIRPMGIFQLIDYVGIEVFKWIMDVMTEYIPNEKFEHHLIEQMVDRAIVGGQRSDGSQKDGFFKYEKGKPVAYFDLQSGKYIAIESVRDRLFSFIGDIPEERPSWKKMVRNRDREKIIGEYFNSLKKSESNGANIALNYLKESKAIAQKLVDDGVAASAQDVNGVLLNGFFHLYGPINDYV